MSDHDAGPDPIDKAYAEAEAVLADETARAARRARVLEAVAVAGAVQATAAKSAGLTRGFFRTHGRWLAAASVAGIALLAGLRLYQPNLTPPQAPAAPVVSAPESSASGAVDTGAATPAPPARQAAGPAQRSAPEAESARDVQTAEAVAPPPLTSPPVAPAPAPQARAAAPSAETNVEEVVVTGAVRREPPAAMAARSAKAAQDSAGAPPDAKSASLRAAGAAGRTSELTALLRQGAPVDAADEQGETALMKAVRANHPAAAALLRRNGADLDLKNHSGQSARDLATTIGDPALNRALGLAQ